MPVCEGRASIFFNGHAIDEERCFCEYRKRCDTERYRIRAKTIVRRRAQVDDRQECAASARIVVDASGCLHHLRRAGARGVQLLVSFNCLCMVVTHAAGIGGIKKLILNELFRSFSRTVEYHSLLLIVSTQQPDRHTRRRSMTFLLFSPPSIRSEHLTMLCLSHLICSRFLKRTRGH